MSYIDANYGGKIKNNTSTIKFFNYGTQIPKQGATGPQGATGFIGASGTCYGDYLYWNNNTSSWKVGSNNINIGCDAGQINQASYGIALGYHAGQYKQETRAIAIGYFAGQTNQGENAIAIGVLAGQNYQNPRSIILNATGSLLNSDGSDRTFVAPIRSSYNNTLVQYNTTTNEITTNVNPFDSIGNLDLSYKNIYKVSTINNTDNIIIDPSDNLIINGTTNLNPTSNILIAGNPYGLSLINNNSKIYPNSASFLAFPGYYTSLELGTNQTINPISPSGFNLVYGDYRNYTKSAGNISDIESLFFTGLQQGFAWTDLNTCKQYVGINNNFNYLGIDANGRSSSFFGNLNNCVLNCPSNYSQTITNITNVDSFSIPTNNINTNTNISNINLVYPACSNIGSGINSIININNFAFFNTSSNFNLTGFASTIRINNMYGLLLPAPTSVVGLIVNNNWGIRQEWSSANNWFAGISNQFPNITTTASAANAFLDSANSNRLFRSTSSIVYKTNIETLNSEYADRIFKLRPIWYRSKCIDDRKDWSWYGLIAEEVAEIEPRLVHYGYQEDAYEIIEEEEEVELDINDERREQGQKIEIIKKQNKKLKKDAIKVPNGVAYERISVLLIDVIKRQEKRIKELESKVEKINELENKIEELFSLLMK